MAIIRPFKAIRPSKDKVHLVVTRSVDMYSKEVMDIRMKTNPYSFLHVLLPDYFSDNKTKPNSPERFNAVKNAFDEFLKEEILVQDNNKNYYVYRQKSNFGTITGLIGLASCEDYQNGIIRKHEDTLTARETVLKDYLKVVDVNAEPVCFTYPDHHDVDNIIHAVCLSEPIFDFTTVDRNRHSLWRISDDTLIDRITSDFEKIPHYYIADGHHRSAASNLLAEEMKANNPNHTGNENYNYFMGVFFSQSQLQIFEYNRIIEGLDHVSLDHLFSSLDDKFQVSELSEACKPNKLHDIHLYVKDKWYKLHPKTSLYEENKPSSQLDSNILSKHILEPIFGITDLKNDKRASFLPGTIGLDELMDKVNSKNHALAFVLHPVTKEQLVAVSDANESMPPKSTWIEPKMRSGMTIYNLGL